MAKILKLCPISICASDCHSDEFKKVKNRLSACFFVPYPLSLYYDMVAFLLT